MKYINKFERFVRIIETVEEEEYTNTPIAPLLDELKPGMEITKCFYKDSSLIIQTTEGYFEVVLLGEEIPEVRISGPGLPDDYSSIDDDPETYFKNSPTEFSGTIKNVIKKSFTQTQIIETEDGKTMKIYC